MQWEELDGEIVVWSHQGNALHLLDTHATAVFLLLDGTRTVAELAAVLSARFHADPATVAHDIEELIARLTALELVGPALL